MDRRAKSPKGKAEPKRSPVRKLPKSDGARVRDLEKRLAEALKREAESLEREKATACALTEALDQRTATGEILRVISSSPADVQPVFNTIMSSIGRLCGATFCAAYRYDGEQLHVVAHDNLTPEMLALLNARYPQPPSRDTATGISTLERRVVHIPDATIGDVPPGSREFARQQGWGSLLAVPLLRDGKPVGNIAVGRAERQPFSEQQIALVRTFADQAVIAIENVRLFTELQTSNRELRTALDTQTATSEILSVISRSQTDLQPVFDTIVRNAVRLCSGMIAGVSLVRDGMLHHPANYGSSPEALAAIRGRYPRPLDMSSSAGVAILTRSVCEAPDVEDPSVFEFTREAGRILGSRSFISVPMLREGEAIGAITVTRQEPGRFSEGEVALLRTFADQAVIAIENVRLFSELQDKNAALTQAHAEVSESLERQTATADILRVISSSPTDAQPVLDVMAESAARLCEAADASIFRVEGDRIRLVAQRGTMPHGPVGEWTLPLVREGVAGRSVIDARTVHLADVTAEAEEFPVTIPNARRVGFRSMLSVPLVRDGVGIGAIQVFRREARLFSERQVALLQTFADQAVIAIENVRLFTELQTSNRDLTKALDTQTATADILGVISRSQTDVQPVFDAILTSAVRLLGAYGGLLTRIVGNQIELVAVKGPNEAAEAGIRAQFPRALQSEGPTALAIRDRAPVNIADYEVDSRVSEAARVTARLHGNRSWVVVPILRHAEPVGTILIARHEPGGFTDDEIALLQTFADQAVIAIENARLLNELQARTDELTRSVDQLTALGEVSRAVSSTLDVETVLNTVVSRASELASADGAAIYEYDPETEQFHMRSTHGFDAAFVEAIQREPVRKGEGTRGRAAQMREPFQVADIAVPGAYEGGLRSIILGAGYRSALSVPLLREEEVIGTLTLTRKTPGEFSPEIVELLKTFATQSALAIQNARLFREIEDKGRQLEAASQHKSEFLANMSHELRTPLNAVIGFSEVLSDGMFGEINEKQAEYLRDILESGRHLLSLINDILDLSKIEAGRMELEAADFDLPSAIDNALILVRERATRRGITLGRTIDDRLGMLRGDERKVKQVLLNLLSNALKFTPEGGRIDVSAHLHDGAAEIAVADTGVGIAPEDQEAIFEEFRQVGTADKKVEGTGLGLALSRKFIELHGGRIWVKSGIGEGSTFTFTLPVRHGE